jgi:site-specific recombinase XerD
MGHERADPRGQAQNPRGDVRQCRRAGGNRRCRRACDAAVLLEFFAATIRNRNTRMAYYRACCSSFAWLDSNGISELADIEPIHVAAYIEALQATAAKPTVTQHLAAVRMLFDYLVVGQVLAINPAHAVRGPSTSSSAARPRC